MYCQSLSGEMFNIQIKFFEKFVLVSKEMLS